VFYVLYYLFLQFCKPVLIKKKKKINNKNELNKEKKKKKKKDLCRFSLDFVYVCKVCMYLCNVEGKKEKKKKKKKKEKKEK